MSDLAETPGSHRIAGERHSRKPHVRKFYTRWWFWSIIIVILVILAAGAWVASRALQAKDSLEAAIPLASSLKSQVLAQDIPTAERTLKQLDGKVDSAQQAVADPVWRIAELVPILGRNLTAVRQLTEVTESVVTRAVAPLMDVARTLNPATFKPVNGAIDMAPLVGAGPAVEGANAAIRSALEELGHIDTSGTISQVISAKKQLSGLLGGIAPTLQTLHTIVPLLPPVLGADGPRTYIVVFQNPAEARALGGTALSTASVIVDKGAVSLGKIVPAIDYAHYGSSVIPVPDGVLDIYKDSFGTFLANATVRPSFVSAATMTHAMWLQQFGSAVDGVISIDPVALGYAVKATGPIPLPTGDVLTSDNLASFLLNEVYQRYPKSNSAQDAVYAAAVDATFNKLASGSFDPKVLLASLGQSWQERRILFWSSHEAEQKQLEDAGLNGELPLSDKKTDRVGVYVSDAIGSKMDFYLNQGVALTQAVCRPDGKANYRVALSLTNTAPANALKALSPSILGNWKFEKVKPGDQRMDVMLYAPPGSTITGASVDGKPVAFESLHDTDYPVAKLRTTFGPGATQTVTFDIVAGTPGVRKLESQVTPLIHPTKVSTGALDCSTVAG